MSSCFRPIDAWRDRLTGRFRFFRDARADQDGPFQWPCQQCQGCRRDKASEWATRLVAEVQASGCLAEFVTLTVDDEHFPESEAQLLRRVRLMLKRLRRSLAKSRGVSDRELYFKTFGCLELGELRDRPHLHIIVMGHRFERGRVVGGSKGQKVYQSPELERLWPYGFSSVGAFTEASAKYVAGYVLKRRRRGDDQGQTVDVVHPLTGELIPFRPAASICISKGRGQGRGNGIGGAWFKRFGEQSLRQGFVMVEGEAKRPIPAYFSKIGRRLWPQLAEDHSEAMAMRANEPAAVAERAPERVEARAEVFRARTKNVRRGSL